MIGPRATSSRSSGGRLLRVTDAMTDDEIVALVLAHALRLLCHPAVAWRGFVDATAGGRSGLG